MHALHLLFPVHLKPFFDINSKVLALLFKAHLGPLFWIKTIRARWVAIVTFPRNHSDLVSATLYSFPNLGSVHIVYRSILFIIDFVVILATHDLTALDGLLPSPRPDLLLSQLIESFKALRWRLNDS